MKSLFRFLGTMSVLACVWQAIILLTAPPAYILPSPFAVLLKICSEYVLLSQHAFSTLSEIALGLLCGISLGCFTAILLQYNRWLRVLFSPLLISSQSIPVYALAPVLTLWFGFGMLPKIIMTVLIIFFPITTAAYDGLRCTPQSYLDLASSMNSPPFRTLLYIRVPAALPSFASGLRVAVAIAPIGAVIGEWVGGSSGLGYLMTYANARGKTDLLFAALVVLVVIALMLYGLTDRLLKRFIRWKVSV
ncbi:MAG: ABC transporter permease [Cardiobacteriaceae bacterium]|nr:ABC transporter permease [Cardiobacteriaceae bacterium]